MNELNYIWLTHNINCIVWACEFGRHSSNKLAIRISLSIIYKVSARVQSDQLVVDGFGAEPAVAEQTLEVGAVSGVFVQKALN